MISKNTLAKTNEGNRSKHKHAGYHVIGLGPRFARPRPRSKTGESDHNQKDTQPSKRCSKRSNNQSNKQSNKRSSMRSSKRGVDFKQIWGIFWVDLGTILAPKTLIFGTLGGHFGAKMAKSGPPKPTPKMMKKHTCKKTTKNRVQGAMVTFEACTLRAQGSSGG